MRLSPGWFNHRNSEVWWNCLRSAVSVIDTSGERHRYFIQFNQQPTVWSAVTLLREILALEPVDAHPSSAILQDRLSFFGRLEHRRAPTRKHFTTDSVLANHTSGAGGGPLRMMCFARSLASTFRLSIASDVSRQMFRDELTKDAISCLSSNPDREVGEDQACPPIRGGIVQV